LCRSNRLRGAVIISAKTRRQIDRPGAQASVARVAPGEGKGVGRGEGDDAGGRCTRRDSTARVKTQEVYATHGAAIGGKCNIASVSSGQGKIVRRTRRGKDPGNLGRIDSRDEGSRVSDSPCDRDPIDREGIPGESTKVEHRQGLRGTSDR